MIRGKITWWMIIIFCIFIGLTFMPDGPIWRRILSTVFLALAGALRMESYRVRKNS